MTFIFYGMEMSPPCTSVTIAMRLAKVQYEYKVIDLMKKAHLNPDFLKINPNHTGMLLKLAIFLGGSEIGYHTESVAKVMLVTSSFSPIKINNNFRSW